MKATLQVVNQMQADGVMQLAALPFGKNLELVEKMRDRSLLLMPRPEKLEQKKVIQEAPQTPK